MDVSTKQLVTLFKETINFTQPNTLEGSAESLRNYYKMTRKFATMANTYQDLIPEEYDVLSILELAEFILDLKIDSLVKSSNLCFESHNYLIFQYANYFFVYFVPFCGYISLVITLKNKATRVSLS